MVNPKILNKVKKKAQKKVLSNVKKKVIPYMKKIIRKDSGALKKSLRAELEETGDDYIIHVIAGDEIVDYAQILEIRDGLFKDGSSLGSRYDELAKLAND